MHRNPDILVNGDWKCYFNKHAFKNVRFCEFGLLCFYHADEPPILQYPWVTPSAQGSYSQSHKASLSDIAKARGREMSYSEIVLKFDSRLSRSITDNAYSVSLNL